MHFCNYLGKDFNNLEYKENWFFDPKSQVDFYGDTLLNKVSVFVCLILK